MKASLDLLGQVPISRLEVKRKLKKMPTVPIEKIIGEIILEKMAGEHCLIYIPTGYKPFLRQFQIKEAGIRITEACEFYSGLCKNQSEYRPYIQSLKRFAKENYKSFQDHAADQKRRNKIIEQVNIAHQLIHEAKHAKNLNLTQLKQICKAHVDPRFIPWEYANDKAIQFAKDIGVYIEPTMPYHFMKKIDDY